MELPKPPQGALFPDRGMGQYPILEPKKPINNNSNNENFFWRY
jgi:hypothetical protein